MPITTPYLQRAALALAIALAASPSSAYFEPEVRVVAPAPQPATASPVQQGYAAQPSSLTAPTTPIRDPFHTLEVIGYVPTNLIVSKGRLVLPIALQMLMPPGWAVDRVAPDLERQVVEWDATGTPGGKPWTQVLDEITKQHGFGIRLDGGQRRAVAARILPAPQDALAAPSNSDATGGSPSPMVQELPLSSGGASGVFDGSATTPFLAEPDLKSWTVAAGKSLRANLQEWCDNSGWTLSWEAGVDYPVIANASFQRASLRDAVDALQMAIDGAPKRTGYVPIRLQTSSNQVLRVYGGTLTEGR